ncbi:MAG: GNAT family N-acetyltransferase [Bdellovibrionales bacterium]|nr:GNAT family N-acetyltransferase [Bdellovibrionales bacterium]
MELSVRNVSSAEKTAIMDFARENPWSPSYPAATLKRFLSELVSSNQLIFDVFRGDERVASAVLLDKVNNPDNDACLEVLGVRAGIEARPLILQIIDLAKERLPDRRSGIQYTRAESSPLTEIDLITKEFVLNFSTFTMENNDLKEEPLSTDDKILLATKADGDLIYRLLCESFVSNLDTSIPDPEVWKASFLTSSKSHYFLSRQGLTTVGFAHLVEIEDADECEVRTIGVLPEFRNLGFGYALLKHCLNEASSLGHKKCHLSVAVQNEKALDLYTRAGFKVISKYKCFRYSR